MFETYEIQYKNFRRFNSKTVFYSSDGVVEAPIANTLLRFMNYIILRRASLSFTSQQTLYFPILYVPKP